MRDRKIERKYIMIRKRSKNNEKQLENVMSKLFGKENMGIVKEKRRARLGG